MQTNVFLGGSDPVLGSNPYNPNISEIEANIQRLQQAQQQMEIQKQRMLNPSAQQAQSRNPVWDEIDKLVSEMSDSEFEMVNNNPEYQQAYQKVMSILNRIHAHHASVGGGEQGRKGRLGGIVGNGQEDKEIGLRGG